MIQIRGKGISSGVAIGPLYYYRRPQVASEKEHREDLPAQKERIRQAQRRAIRQLQELARKAREEAGNDAASVFEAQMILIEEEDFTSCILSAVDEESCNAEYAVLKAGRQFSGMLAAAEDEYTRARAADILDVSRRLIYTLCGRADGGIDSEVPVILAADDLTPSETVQLDRSRILGLLLQGGSATGHTAILARTMGIPTICGMGETLGSRCSGLTCCMDGEAGIAVIDPDDALRRTYLEKIGAERARKDLLEQMKGLEDVTLDGQRVRLYCNINSAEDIPSVLENDGRGIGLFRSEIIYLQSSNYPDEERLFREYRRAAAAMNGKPVIIRTLDIGADKQADFLRLGKEENPSMGVRGIRICLNRPEIFRTQLRALYRASAYGNIAIMFPMIASVWEVEECRSACESARAELRSEGIPFREDTELGIMIETPASVFLADELAKRVDFFSVGTNDLTQYLLACDRQNNNLDKFYDPHHPAVIQAIRLAAEAAHRNGIRIGICGELGSDPDMLQTFLELGIDEISVSPSAVLPLRAAIRSSRAHQ